MPIKAASTRPKPSNSGYYHSNNFPAYSTVIPKMSKSLLILSLLATSLCLTMAADLTWYDNAGLGACGPYVNALTDNIAAISKLRWTTANPNNDPLCGLCVTVSWQGKK